MVVWVFFTAKQLLDAPPTTLPTPAPTPKPLPGATPAPTNALGETALRGLVAPTVDFLRRLLTLLLLSIVGSLVAALGIRWWGKR